MSTRQTTTSPKSLGHVGIEIIQHRTASEPQGELVITFAAQEIAHQVSVMGFMPIQTKGRHHNCHFCTSTIPVKHSQQNRAVTAATRT